MASTCADSFMGQSLAKTNDYVGCPEELSKMQHPPTQMLTHADTGGSIFSLSFFFITMFLKVFICLKLPKKPICVVKINYVNYSSKTIIKIILTLYALTNALSIVNLQYF